MNSCGSLAYTCKMVPCVVFKGILSSPDVTALSRLDKVILAESSVNKAASVLAANLRVSYIALLELCITKI